MAAARSGRYLDNGWAREEPSRRTVSGLSRVVLVAGQQLAAKRPGDAPAFSPARRVPSHAVSPDVSDQSHHTLVRSDRERADRDDVAIAVTLDAIGERAVDGGLFGGRL